MYNAHMSPAPTASPSSPPPRSDSVRVWSIALLAFLIGLLLSGSIMLLYETKRQNLRRQAVTDLTIKAAHDIQEQLNRSLSSTYALASVIRQGNGRIDNFQELAKEMLELYPGLSALQLVPGGVITEIYPLKGNEKAIGLNLLDKSNTNKEALSALRHGSLTLAGPFELVQGGLALMGRLPVYVKGAEGQKRFWGFTAAMIRLEAFFDTLQLHRTLSADFNYRISRIKPDTGTLDLFWKQGGELTRPVSQKIVIPNGEWNLSVEPVGGWYQWRVLLAEGGVVLVLSTLAALTAYWLARQPVVLRRMVEERTREFSEINDRLKSEVVERRHAEEALQASDLKLRSIFASLTEVILVLDAEGRYLEIAPTSTKKLYLPPDELLGKKIPDLFPKEQADLFVSTIGKALAAGTTVTVDYSLNIEGEEVWFTGNVTPMPGGRVIWSAHDITQRKRAEEERLKLEKQMLHAQKLESLGVLAGGIAHDFNNILTVIVGNTDLALMRLTPDSPAVENLRRIEMAATRASDLAHQMLAYSGKGHFITEELDLNRLVEEMGHMLSVSVSKKARLSYHLSRPLPAVTADATQIRQVLMNLVINASEAIGDQNGVITVSTGCVQCTESRLDGGWLSDPVQPGPYVYLEVSDTGCGMDRDTMAKIFEPFFTTKFTGRGLGMAAVLGIVRGHLGAIRVQSEPGRGSTFRVVLPAGDAPARLRYAESESGENWRGSGTVLLIDDEDNIRALGSEMLGELGFQVVSAADGREGMEIFCSRNDIVLVLLDLTMPQMDGEQCLRELRRIDPRVRVVMSSGFSEHEVSGKFLGKGISGFVQKPYKLSALREVLSSLNLESSPPRR
ncbi:response regulator [Geomonas nitrogeniifigens]|uniref:histidine kinase n=1 Tax=Geomonas diazotrophica TaxID=2843197 RepID=A0ABX8JL23_9BACT|nr:response regulator [Geomonas nitrogeniifigens]QWV98458.1 response regulator [Geomonas nitrogeniifigens]QXE87640.1 response regulator [Geomonas nitrogeniifigens]